MSNDRNDPVADATSNQAPSDQEELNCEDLGKISGGGIEIKDWGFGVEQH